MSWRNNYLQAYTSQKQDLSLGSVTELQLFIILFEHGANYSMLFIIIIIKVRTGAVLA